MCGMSYLACRPSKLWMSHFSELEVKRNWKSSWEKCFSSLLVLSSVHDCFILLVHGIYYSVSHSLPNLAFIYGRPPVCSSNKVPMVSSFFDKAQMLDLLGGCRPPNFSRNCCWHDIKEMPGSVVSGTHCFSNVHLATWGISPSFRCCSHNYSFVCVTAVFAWI
jgi:hypothetical protein